MALSLGVAVVAATAGSSSQAFAEQPGRAANARRIVVVDLSPDEKEHAEILHEVRAALEQHVDAKGLRDYVVVTTHASLNAGGEVQEQQNAATVKGLLGAGRAAMDAKDYDDATDQYMSALKLLEGSLGVLEGDDQEVLHEVLLGLGSARLEAGDKEGADRAFRRAAASKADASGLSERAKRAYAAAEASIQSMALGAVQVNTDPVYAEIYVDGRYKGISPKAVAGLIEGPHIITVYKQGYTRPTVTVDVNSTKMAHQEIKLDTARRALLLDELKPKMALATATAHGEAPTGGTAVKELGDLFRTETSLVVRVGGARETKSLELYLFHTESQRLVATEKIASLDWSFRNRKAIAASIDKLLDFDWVAVLGGKTGDDIEEPGILEQWWFWTAVGVVVAGGTTAAILLSQDGAGPPPFTKDGTGAMVLRF
ncbi:MAG: PEGA domain-containing protein [Deltaproteobacteria bacterium]|nr:MAG: PEGA domain-containing protein [Deltaproteobacteria bacterium]